jgi:NAD(P) transhydrogenase subunit alpha
MYAKNLVTFLLSLTKEGELDIDLNDEVIRDTLAAKDGQVQSERLREMLGLEPLVLPPAKPPVDQLAESND